MPTEEVNHNPRLQRNNDIVLAEDWKISPLAGNFLLLNRVKAKRKTNTKGYKKGDTYLCWQNIGYYNTISGALTRWTSEVMLDGADAETGLVEKYELLAKSLAKLERGIAAATVIVHDYVKWADEVQAQENAKREKKKRSAA